MLLVHIAEQECDDLCAVTGVQRGEGEGIDPANPSARIAVIQRIGIEAIRNRIAENGVGPAFQIGLAAAAAPGDGKAGLGGLWLDQDLGDLTGAGDIMPGRRKYLAVENGFAAVNSVTAALIAPKSVAGAGGLCDDPGAALRITGDEQFDIGHNSALLIGGVAANIGGKNRTAAVVGTELISLMALAAAGAEECSRSIGAQVVQADDPLRCICGRGDSHHDGVDCIVGKTVLQRITGLQLPDNGSILPAQKICDGVDERCSSWYRSTVNRS